MNASATATIIAAAVAALVSIAVWWLTSRRGERLRKREMYANAYAAYTSYREFPYVVRRRRADQPADERQRISMELRDVQEKLNYYLAWTQLESKMVGKKYAHLITAARTIAGAAISAAWDGPPASEDADMHVRDVDLSALTPHEDAYLASVKTRFQWWRP